MTGIMALFAGARSGGAGVREGCTWDAAVVGVVRRTVLLLALLAFARGCGSGSSDQTRRPSQAEIDDFVNRFCSVIVACCVKAQTLRANEDSCHSRLRVKIDNFNPEAGQGCLDELEQASGADGKTASCLPNVVSFADPCSRMFDGHYGSTAPGGECMRDSDCAAAPGGPEARSICVGSKCKWESPGAAGDGPCAGETGPPPFVSFLSHEYANQPVGYICQREKGLYCTSPDDPMGSCLPLKPLGAACDLANECATERCNGGKCAEPLGPGASCLGTFCASGNYCNDSSICVAMAEAGASCSKDVECATGRCVDTACSTATVGLFIGLALYCG